MTPQTQDLATVVERVETLGWELRVEKRRTRWLLGAVGLALVGVALAWAWANTTAIAQAQGPKVIRANHFILEDENGKARAELTVIAGGPTLVLGDENGTVRVALAMTRGGPGLSL